MTSTTTERAGRVAFQGEPGAYANLAAREALPHAMAIPKPTFEHAVAAVREGETDLAIIPVENSVMGRIADIHHLLPDAGLYIVGEHFLRIEHQLLGVKGASLAGLKRVFSQQPALMQCRKTMAGLKIKEEPWHDTAGSAKHVAELNDPASAAIASSLAGEIYGVDVLKSHVEDKPPNMTRFLIMAAQPDDAPVRANALGGNSRNRARPARDVEHTLAGLKCGVGDQIHAERASDHRNKELLVILRRVVAVRRAIGRLLARCDRHVDLQSFQVTVAR